MRQISLQSYVPGLVLDVCTPCELVWFDPGELAQLPKPRPLSAQGEKLVAGLEEELKSERPNVEWVEALNLAMPGGVAVHFAPHLIRGLIALLRAIGIPGA